MLSCVGAACKREAVIMTGRGEMTVKGRDMKDQTREPRDGNACHIDEATAAEVSDRLGFASPLPLSLLGSARSHFISFLFCRIQLFLSFNLLQY